MASAHAAQNAPVVLMIGCSQACSSKACPSLRLGQPNIPTDRLDIHQAMAQSVRCIPGRLPFHPPQQEVTLQSIRFNRTHPLRTALGEVRLVHLVQAVMHAAQSASWTSGSTFGGALDGFDGARGVIGA
jgi:hypothetical protein